MSYPSMLGSPSPALGVPNAPPPGTPPPVPNAGHTTPTTSNERLLAGAAYLGYLTGFWFVLAGAIYVWQRERSRFVAHHALRAVLLHLSVILVLVASYALFFGCVVAAAALSGPDGRELGAAAGPLMTVVSILAAMLPWVIHLIVAVHSAIRAFQGKIETRSWLGRAVERLLGGDPTVTAPAAH